MCPQPGDNGAEEHEVIEARHGVGAILSDHPALLQVVRRESPTLLSQARPQRREAGPVSVVADIESIHADITGCVGGTLLIEAHPAGFVRDIPSIVAGIAKFVGDIHLVEAHPAGFVADIQSIVGDVQPGSRTS